MFTWFLQDIRFGLRMTFKHPALSVVAILIFGLGIGLTATVFSVVNGVFYKGLPFEDGNRIVVLWNTNPSRNELDMPMRADDYLTFRERQTVFEDLAIFSVAPANLAATPGRPERFTCAQISANAFGILRTNPVLGRTFRPGEGRPGADPVAIISFSVWRNHLGGSADVLGKPVRINGIIRTIVGVMPRGFAFPGFENLWIPLDIGPLTAGRDQAPTHQVFGRLKRGVAFEQARAEVSAIAADLESRYPQTNRGISATIRPYSENFLKPQLYALMQTMLGAGIGVLLIACVNVANLLLARSAARRREFAIRMAVGARPSRILMQLLTEALILAGAGGLLGFWFSMAAMSWFVSVLALNPPPFWMTFELDHRVLMFVTGITAVAGLFAGLIPAWQMRRSETGDELKDKARTSRTLRVVRLSGTFVVAEVAISCALLIAAGLMIRSIVNLRQVKMHFAVDRILTARTNLPRADYADSASRIRFYRQLLTRLQIEPGVESAAMSSGLPAAGSGSVSFQIEGGAEAPEAACPIARQEVVTPGYFQTIQARVLQGREFTELDLPGALPVAIVNESFARTFLPNANPIGSRLRIVRATERSPWLVIVGVAPDLLMQGLGNINRSPAGIYLPLVQSEGPDSISIIVRTRGEPMQSAGEVRAAVASLNQDLPIFNNISMREVISRQGWLYMVLGTFFLVLGFSGLILALAGLYAVMSFNVTQRTRELSIRAALGARGSQLVLLVVRRGVIQLASGMTLGLGLGLVMALPLQSFLYEVKAHDPALIMTVLAALTAAGLLANLIPARRITKIDVATALASE